MNLKIENKILVPIGIVFLVIVVTVAVSVNNIKAPNSPARNENSASVAAQQVGFDSIAEWNTYTDEEYGFKFKYPAYYENFEESPMASHKKDISLEKMKGGGFQIKYKSIVNALASRKAESRNKNIGELRVDVYDLNSYAISNIPSGVEFWFDQTKDQWWQNTGESKSVSFLPQVKAGDGIVGYKTEIGDAGEGFEYVIIPLKERGVMIEISFYKGIDTTENAPIDTILSTLKVI